MSDILGAKALYINSNSYIACTLKQPLTWPNSIPRHLPYIIVSEPADCSGDNSIPSAAGASDPIIIEIVLF